MLCSRPVFMVAVGDIFAAMMQDEDKVADAFKTGHGVGWDTRTGCLFCGTARFFRTSYLHHLVQDWLPSLDGVVDKLERGATVADVGCGHGVSTVLMARAFPKSRFFGFDYHDGSIDAARQARDFLEPFGRPNILRQEVEPIGPLFRWSMRWRLRKGEETSVFEWHAFITVENGSITMIEGACTGRLPEAK